MESLLTSTACISNGLVFNIVFSIAGAKSSFHCSHLSWVRLSDSTVKHWVWWPVPCTKCHRGWSQNCSSVFTAVPKLYLMEVGGNFCITFFDWYPDIQPVNHPARALSFIADSTTLQQTFNSLKKTCLGKGEWLLLPIRLDDWIRHDMSDKHSILLLDET